MTATDTQTTDTHELPDSDLEFHWIAVLSEFWRQADWDQFSNQQKSRADTFGERIEVAGRAGDVHGALQKLAKGLGIAVPELPTENLDPLVANNTRAMRLLRRENVWLVNKTDETVRSYFAALNNDDSPGEDTDPEPTTTELSDFITTTTEEEEEDDS